MQELNILIGGETGYGINETGVTLCRLLSRLGYSVYMYNDFPSNVRGGHQFALVRASLEKISAHKIKVDAVIAFQQKTIDLHQEKISTETIILFDSENVSVEEGYSNAIGLPLPKIVFEAKAKREWGGFCMIGALCKALNIDLAVFENLLKDHHPGAEDTVLRLAETGYGIAGRWGAIDVPGVSSSLPAQPVLSGSQAIALGLLKAGLKAYIAYPMTPTSPIMEFLASSAPKLKIQTVPPESEIAVMMMALGYSYMGIKNAVGTSGGGFSLMVEGLGLSGIAELPVLIVMGQRAGPSTGMPTYTSQTDLHFVLNASQGEFPRLVVAPGNAEEAYYWAGTALNKAWKYQIPAFVLTDKVLNLGFSSFDPSIVDDLAEEEPLIWDGKGEYQRYKDTDTGVSPLAFPPVSGQSIKTNSYVHDEKGIVSEDPAIAKGNMDKRLLKERHLSLELEQYETVKQYGEGRTALICWGSNKGVCIEAAGKFGLKVIQPVLLSPFPEKALKKALEGVDRTITVECNGKGQLAMLMNQHGFHTDKKILKYDGRPFSVEELEKEVKEAMA